MGDSTKGVLADVLRTVEILAGSRQQCDEDGQMIAVSRQALEELFADVAALAQPAGDAVATLPIEIHGSHYEVPVAVHVRFVGMADELSRNVVGQPFVRNLLGFAEHCISAAEEGEDYAVSRPMLDAMTTLGLMEKVGRGKWAPTPAAEQFVKAGNTASPVAAGEALDAARLRELTGWWWQRLPHLEPRAASLCRELLRGIAALTQEQPHG